jgi:hypothetical protein
LLKIKNEKIIALLVGFLTFPVQIQIQVKLFSKEALSETLLAPDGSRFSGYFKKTRKRWS